MRHLLIASVVGPILLLTAGVSAAMPAITARSEPGPVKFAAGEIAEALRGRETQGVKEIVLEVSRTGPAQGYRFSRPAADTLVITGSDACGAMYGGLDVAEAIRLGTLADLKGEHAPYIARRGIKFNIPLDARTPSYSDAGDAAQQNIPEMWSMDFWRAFLDDMARHRYNVLSLWNLHPFPSMVKVPEYPDVALDDVMRTTVKFDSTYKTNGSDLVRPEHLAHLETVKKLTITEKIWFWREVMQYAHYRGIEVYIFTWNIFTFGAEGKYGITSAQDNPVTIDYFRKSVREMLVTYPLLAGFGITAGENMQKPRDDRANERWLWKTYGEGIRDVKRLQPERTVRLIHRFHQTKLKSVTNAWKDYPGPFEFSYKYSVAHMYSSPTPPFAAETLTELPRGMRTWMTIRNDDIYSFRWGDPEYARAYIKGLPGPDKLAGYYMGPDGYIWGREFISTEPDTPRQLVIAKQWYSFMLWGRLSYDPTLPDALFERALAARFPEAPGKTLYEASCAASRIIPQITRFFWGDIDLKWFPEACISHPGRWYTVRDFIEGETMPGCGILNIRAWRAATLAGRPAEGITPLQVAENLHTDATATLRLLEPMPKTIGNKELRLTVGDLRAMAHLGDYYAEKILGAADLALFDKSGKPQQQVSAVGHLVLALEHWKQYASVYGSQYRPQLLSRIGYVDISQLTEKVAADVTMAQEWKPGTIGADTPRRRRPTTQPEADTAGATKVPRWKPHDFAFASRQAVDNPFLTPFSAEVTGPGATRLLLPGFYDGEGTWKVRVSPTAEGEWEIVTRSTVPALDGQRARFVCTGPSLAVRAQKESSPGAHGGVRVDPQHPRQFVYEDGTRFLPMGYECDWLWALDAADPQLPTVNRLLDTLSASGFNYVLLNAYAHDTSWRPGNTDEDDYGPPPMYPWGGSNEKPDHGRFNLAYWQHFDRVIAALNEHGMVAHLMIKVYNKMVNWPAQGSPEDDLYFRWLIARYAAYPNIHWDFSKESNNEKDLAYKLGRIRFIREHDPYRRPITTHTDLKAYDSGAYDGVLDYRCDQVHKDWHGSLLKHREQRTWPVLNVEFGYEHGPGGLEDKTYRVAQSPEEVCRRAWEVYMAGGFGAYYYTYTAWDVIRPNDTPPGYRYFRHLRDFFEGTGYWRMEPSDELVSEGFCLADPGREYVVFLNKTAPFTLQLAGLNAEAKAEWFHPFTGELIGAGSLGNGTQRLAPPDQWGNAPVVLHVGPTSRPSN